MCIVCKDWELGKLTSKEALRNLGEFISLSDENIEELNHYYMVVEKITDELTNEFLES